MAESRSKDRRRSHGSLVMKILRDGGSPIMADRTPVCPRTTSCSARNLRQYRRTTTISCPVSFRNLIVRSRRSFTGKDRGLAGAGRASFKIAKRYLYMGVRTVQGGGAAVGVGRLNTR